MSSFSVRRNLDPGEAKVLQMQAPDEVESPIWKNVIKSLELSGK